MNTLVAPKPRIEWIDVFKGIAILCVVMGHAASPINGYIYLFHMGAFFFISGYTSNLDQKTFLQTLASKLYSIILPFIIVFIVFAFLQWIFNQAGIYHIFWSSDFPGLKQSLLNLMHNTISIDLLGATWFLIALFGCYLIQKLVLMICSNKIGFAHILISFLLFLFGYYLIQIGFRSYTFLTDLALIAQLYFAMGIWFKKYDVFKKLFTHNWVKLVVLPLLLVIMYFLLQAGATVNYPTRTFGNNFLNLSAVLCGVFLLYILSCFIVKVPLLKKQFILFGQNSLGILFFHFAAFRVFFVLLYCAHCIPASYLQNLVPSEVTWFWLPLSIFAVYLSLLIWLLLTQNKFIRTLLGQNKSIVKNLNDKTRSISEKITSRFRRDQ